MRLTVLIFISSLSIVGIGCDLFGEEEKWACVDNFDATCSHQTEDDCKTNTTETSVGDISSEDGTTTFHEGKKCSEVNQSGACALFEGGCEETDKLSCEDNFGDFLGGSCDTQSGACIDNFGCDDGETENDCNGTYVAGESCLDISGSCVDNFDACTDTVAANCDFPDDFNIGESCP